jgi:hypothetical protein
VTEQTKKLNQTQLKRWKLALKEAAKINRKLKKNNGSILIDTKDNSIINSGFNIFKEDDGISTLGYMIDRCLFSKGDNDLEYDNGIIYSKLEDIKNNFNRYKVYKEL